jgi:hypothetical protein
VDEVTARAISQADSARVAAAVDRLLEALNEGAYLERAFAAVARDSSALERVALRVLELPVEREELVVEQRREAGERFVGATNEAERRAALAHAFPELADGDDEESELYVA